MKKLLLLSVFAGLCEGVFAQRGHEGLAWVGISTRLAPDTSRWRAEATYQYMAYRRASRFYAHFGSLHLFYRPPKTSLTLSPGYVHGQVAGVGRLHLVQLRLIQDLSQLKLNPHIRLTVDRLWFGGSSDSRASALTRVRLQFAVIPRVGRGLQLVAFTEPFPYHPEGWFKEVRSQVGIRWEINRHFLAETGYFNRWRGYATAGTAWEHAAMVLLVLRLKSDR